MSQNPIVVPDSNGATFINNVNNALNTIMSNSGGAGEPGTNYPTQWFGNTTDKAMRLRNIANTAYKTVGSLDIDWGIGHNHGKCLLRMATATQLRLAAWDGNTMIINGKVRTIPSADVTMSNGGLAANTVYHIYAADTNNDNIVDLLEASTTVYVVSDGSVTPANAGVRIKTGDDTRTLVGLIRTNASAQFEDNLVNRLVCSAFNQPPRSLLGGLAGSNMVTSSAPWVELSTSVRVSWAALSNSFWLGSPVRLVANGSAANDTSAGGAYIGVGLNGTLSGAGNYFALAGASIPNVSFGLSSSTHAVVADGYHFATVLGGRFSVGSATYNASHLQITGAV